MGYSLLKGTRYKLHYICFVCRKNFKQPNPKDVAERKGELSLLLNGFYLLKPKKEIPADIVAYLQYEYFDKKVICPECGTGMLKVPMSFETPPKKNIKEWKILKSFYEAQGFVTNALPDNKKMLIAVLENSLEWHIHMLQNAHDHKSYLEKLTDAKVRLQQEIEAIRSELNKLKL